LTTDLFQGLTVGLLAAIAILLIAVTATLARLGSALRSLSERVGSGSLQAASSQGLEAATATGAGALGASGAGRAGGLGQHAEEGDADVRDAPAPDAGLADFPDAASAEVDRAARERAEVERAARERPAAETPWDDEAARARAEEATAASDEESAPRAATEEAEPIGVAASAREAESPRSAVEEEPQDQPFERDGRWWFRRGDELLVYDEQSGEWLQAPGPTAGAGTLAGGSPSSAYGSVATEARTSTVSEQERSEQSSGGFWKCPACGAANGPRENACRMCFTARPS
jgi:hypothetical protein